MKFSPLYKTPTAAIPVIYILESRNLYVSSCTIDKTQNISKECHSNSQIQISIF